MKKRSLPPAVIMSALLLIITAGCTGAHSSEQKTLTAEGKAAVYEQAVLRTGSRSGSFVSDKAEESIRPGVYIQNVKRIGQAAAPAEETQAAAQTIPQGVSMLLVVIAVIILLLIIVISNVKIVPQAMAYIIERLGAYQTIWQVGLHLKLPFIERIANRISLKEKVIDFKPQPVITKDNVTMMIDTVIYYQITDPKLYTYGVENPMSAIENLSATTLRNIIGELELDGTLTSRDLINTRMRSILDEATDPWGIKVNRVEVKNIMPPESILEAMEKQMRAERERRESILRAEGEKQSAILVAEGKKASVILQAEAAKEAAIRNAEGEAEAILAVQKATADGLVMLKEAGVDEAVIRLKSLETLQKVADGQATKIIIPSDIQNLAGLVTSVSELARGGK